MHKSPPCISTGGLKNARPQCNATFMATAQSITIVEKWYSIFEKKNEVGNAFLTLIFFTNLAHFPDIFF